MEETLYPATSFPAVLQNAMRSDAFGITPDEEKPLLLDSIRRGFISRNNITKPEDIEYINTNAEKEFQDYRNILNIPRFTPTSQQAQELLGPINFKASDPIDVRIKAIEDWRDGASAKAGEMMPANKTDLDIYAEDLANNFIRTELAKEDYQPGGMPDWLTDKFKRAIEGFGAKQIFDLVDYKESQRFFAKNLIENPEYDEDISSELATGFSQFMGQAVVAAAITGTTKNPSLIGPTFLALYGSHASQEAYQREIKRTGNELQAAQAAINSWPSAVLDVGPEAFIAMKAGNLFTKFSDKFIKAVDGDAKKAVINEFLPQIMKETVKGAASEGIIGGGMANIASSLGDYFATGNQEYLDNASDIKAIGRDVLVSGILGGTFSGGLTALSGSNTDAISKSLEVLTKQEVKAADIKAALDAKDYTKVVEMVAGKTISPEEYNLNKNISSAIRGIEDASKSSDPTVKEAAMKSLSERLGEQTVEAAKASVENRPYVSTLEKIKKGLTDQSEIDYIDGLIGNFFDADEKGNKIIPKKFTPETEIDAPIENVFEVENEKGPQEPKNVTVKLNDGTEIKNDGVFYVDTGKKHSQFVAQLNIIKMLEDRLPFQVSKNGRHVKFGETDKTNGALYNTQQNPSLGFTPVIVANGKIRILSPVSEIVEKKEKEQAAAINPKDIVDPSAPKQAIQSPSTKVISDFSNEGTFYRVVVGDEAFNDIVESGQVRTNQGSKLKGGETLTEKLKERPTEFPSFSKGKVSELYARENHNHYIIETNDASIQPSTSGRHSKGKTHFPTNEKGEHQKSLSGKVVRVYKHVGEGNYQLVYENGTQITPVSDAISNKDSVDNDITPQDKRDIDGANLTLERGIDFTKKNGKALGITEPVYVTYDDGNGNIHPPRLPLVMAEKDRLEKIGYTLDLDNKKVVRAGIHQGIFIPIIKLTTPSQQQETQQEIAPTEAPVEEEAQLEVESVELDPVVDKINNNLTDNQKVTSQKKGVKITRPKKTKPVATKPAQHEKGIQAKQKGKKETKQKEEEVLTVDEKEKKDVVKNPEYYAEQKSLNDLNEEIKNNNKIIRNEDGLYNEEQIAEARAKSQGLIKERDSKKSVKKGAEEITDKEKAINNFIDLANKNMLRGGNIRVHINSGAITLDDLANKAGMTTDEAGDYELLAKKLTQKLKGEVKKEKTEEEILKERIDKARKENERVLKKQKEDTPENKKRRKEQASAVKSLAKDVGLKKLRIVNSQEELKDTNVNDTHQAFVENGEVTFILDNIIPYPGESHVEAIQRIFKHEVVGHLKVSQVLSGIDPVGFKSLVDFLKTLKYKGGDSIWNERSAAYKEEDTGTPEEFERLIVDEIFAKLAESKDKQSRSIIQKIINWVRINLLKKGHANWTTNDLDIILQEAFNTELNDGQGNQVAFSKNVDAVRLNSSLKGHYGAWLSSDGKLITVGYQNHLGKALEILGEDADDMDVNDVYTEMYARGYIRLVNLFSGVVGEGDRITSQQRAIMEFIGINDDKNVELNNKIIYRMPSQDDGIRFFSKQDRPTNEFKFRLEDNLSFPGLVASKDGTVPTQNLIAKIKKSGALQFEVDTLSKLAEGLTKDGRINIEEFNNVIKEQPTVVVSELAFNKEQIPDRKRFNEIIHELDSTNYEFGFVGTELRILNSVSGNFEFVDIKNVPDNIKKLYDEASKLDLFNNNSGQAATGKYGVDPYSNEYLKGTEARQNGKQKAIWSGDLSLNVPLKTGVPLEQRVSFTSQHYDGDVSENQLAFVRGAIHEYQEGATLPDGSIANGGEQVYEIWELQSDWANRERRNQERYIADEAAFDENLGSTPIVEYYETLALKAALNFAARNNVSNIVISDAESVMLNEGHDKVIEVARSVDGKDIYKGVTSINLTSSGSSHEGALNKLKSIAKSHNGNKLELYGNGKAEIDDNDIIHITKEPFIEGDRQAYDRNAPNILQKLTGQKPAQADMGAHEKLSFVNGNISYNPEAIVRIENSAGSKFSNNDLVKVKDIMEERKRFPGIVFDALGNNPGSAVFNYRTQNTGRMFKVEGSSGIRFSKSDTERGQIGFDKKQMLQLLGPSMYNKPIAQVAVKELLQNSFDALKAKESLTGSKDLNLNIKINRDERTISITDDGIGMTKDIVKKAFLTIGGTNKEGLTESQRSGGKGLAKVQILLGAESVKVNTVRDGVKTTINATALELYEDDFNIETESTNEPNGTNVEIKIPKSYTTIEGIERSIDFPGYNRGVGDYASFDVLTKPLIGNINATVEITNKGKVEKGILPIGNKVKMGDDKVFITGKDSNSALEIGDIIDRKDFIKEEDRIREENKYSYMEAQPIISPALYSNAEFDWGNADIYISEEKKEHPKHYILSSGLYQFSKPFYDSSYETVPYDIVIDIKPKVSAASEQYPFNNQREDFAGTIQEDIKALTLFINQFALGESDKELIDVFKEIKTLPKTNANDVLTSEEREKIFQAVDDINDRNKSIEYTPREIKDIYISKNKVIDTKTKKVIADTKEKDYKSTFKSNKNPDLSQSKDVSFIDQDSPQFHNNTNVDYLSIEGADIFFSDLGSVLLDLVRYSGNNFPGFEVLKGIDKKFFAGISISKGNGGIHIRKLFQAIFINPLAFTPKTKEEAVGISLHSMLHEINHTVAWNEGADFTTALAKLYGLIYGSGQYGYFEGLVRSVYSKHFETFQKLKQEYDKSSTRNLSKGFEGSNIKGSDIGSVPSDETNVSTGQSAGIRHDRDGSNNTEPSLGDVAVSNISNNNIRFSKQDNTTEQPVKRDYSAMFEDNNFISESRKSLIKDYVKTLKKAIEQRLIIKEVNIRNAFKDIAVFHLDDNSLQDVVKDLHDFVDTRRRQSDPVTERIEVDKLEANLIRYKKLSLDGEYAYWKEKTDRLPDWDTYFNKDIGKLRNYIKQVVGGEENEDIANVILNDEDIATAEAIIDLQFEAINRADELEDVINRLVVEFSKDIKPIGDHILDKGVEIQHDYQMAMKRLFNEYILDLITTDTSNLKSRAEVRRVYYSLLSLVTDGYPNRLNTFISSDISNLLKQTENRFRNPYTTMTGAKVSRLANNPGQIEALATDNHTYHLLVKLQTPLREGLKLAKRYHEEIITPYIVEKIKEYESDGSIMNADTENKIGIYGILRQYFLTETRPEDLKANIQWLLDSNKNIMIFDKSFSNQGKRHNEYVFKLLEGIKYEVKDGQLIADFTNDDVATFESNAKNFIGEKGIKYADDIVKLFESMKPLSRFTTEFIHGRTFEEIGNYIPTMSVIVKGEGRDDGESPDIGKIQLMTDAKSVSTGKIFYGTNITGLGTTKHRAREVGTNRTLVLNINYQAESIGRLAVYDMFTAHARQEMSQLLNFKTKPGKLFAKFLGDPENGKGRTTAFRNAINGMWQNEMSMASYMHPWHQAVNWYARKWSQSVLSGGHQLISQSVSNTIPYFVQHINEPHKIANYGRAILYYIKYKTGQLTPHQEKIVKNVLFEVRNRQQFQEIDKSVNLNINPNSMLEWFKTNMTVVYKGLKLTDKVIERALFIPFRASDLISGTPIVLAEYLNHYQDRHGRHLGFEDLTYDPEMYVKAIDDTERYLGIGDASRRGEFLTNRNAGVSIIRNLLVAFRSFTLNNAYNFSKEMHKLRDSDVSPEAKTKALRYMMGIVAQSVMFNAIKITIGGMFGKAIISLLMNPDDDEELKKLHRKSLGSMDEKSRRALDAEISMRQQIKKTLGKVNERNIDERIIMISTAKDTLQNMFVLLNLDFIPELYIHIVHDETEAESFKGWKNSEVERINKLIKRHKNLGNTKTVVSLKEELATVEMQEFIPVTFENRSISNMGGSFGGTVKGLEEAAKSASKAFIGTEKMGVADFLNITTSLGVSQPELKKYFKAKAAIDKIKKEKEEKLEKIR